MHLQPSFGCSLLLGAISRLTSMMVLLMGQALR